MTRSAEENEDLDGLPRDHQPAECELALLSVLRNWNNRSHRCTTSSRFNIEPALEASNAFLHHRDTNPQIGSVYSTIGKHFLRHSTPFILHLNNQFMVVSVDPDSGCGAARMPVNVHQAFLHDPKHRALDFLRHTAQVRRYRQIHRNAAALGKPITIPPKSVRQADFVQNGRVQQVGKGPDLAMALLGERAALIEGSSRGCRQQPRRLTYYS